MPNAIALYSGGLDSLLASLVVRTQRVGVTAVTFITSFGCGDNEKIRHTYPILEKFGIGIKNYDISEKFLKVLQNPCFGYGKNLNPCVDCKILFLREAKQLMPIYNADFIITGEVIWQRPMSQRKDALYKIEREADLHGYLLRPLSAKLLNPTIAEQQGIINREKFFAFQGRSRKPQIALAKDFGLTYYQQPGGGCLLTDPSYTYRLKELLRNNNNPSIKDIKLLKYGRHFRISQDCKVIVGRNEKDNKNIKTLADDNDCQIIIENYSSPLTLVTGHIQDESISLAASLCARYSDANNLQRVGAMILIKNLQYKISIQPAYIETIKNHLIQKGNNL